jgi:O-antigen ligase
MGPRLVDVSHAHSLYLQQFVGSGFLGLVFFLALLAAIFRGVLPFRRQDPQDIVRAALGAGVIGLLCHGIADFLLEKQLGLAFWLALGLLVSSGRRSQDASASRSS